MAKSGQKKSFLKHVPRPGDDVMAKFYGGNKSPAKTSRKPSARSAAKSATRSADQPDSAALQVVSGRQGAPAAAARVVSLRCDQIRPDPQQPRKTFEAGALEELAESMRLHGQLQPALVRPDPNGDEYILIAGERRWRACMLAERPALDAIVHDVDAVRAFEMALAENVQRDSLLPLEEARAYQHLAEVRKISQSELARLLGIDRRRVSEKLALLQLSEEVQSLLETNPPLLPEGHAVLLTRAPEHVDVVPLAKRCAAEGWSVRRLRDALKTARPASSPRPTLFENVRMTLNRRGGFTLTVRARSRDEVEKTIAELEEKIRDLRSSFLAG